MPRATRIRETKAGASSRKPDERPWPVTAIGLLLILQAAILLGLGILHFGEAYLVDLDQMERFLEQSAGEQFLSPLPERVRAWIEILPQAVNEQFFSNMTVGKLATVSFLFLALSVLAALSAVAFLRVRAGAWTYAMLVQGLNLSIALIFYFTAKPIYVYLLMLYGILLVLYLNYHEVRVAFQPKSIPGGNDSA